MPTEDSQPAVAKDTGADFAAALKYADLQVFPLLMEHSLGLTEGPAPDYPLWVRRCADKLGRAVYPKVYEALDRQPVDRAYCRGAAFGLMVAGQKKWAAALKQIEMPETPPEQMQVAWKLLQREDAAKHPLPSDGDLIPSEIREEMRQQELLFSQVELQDYVRGYSDATDMTFGKNKATETTAILGVLLVYWRVIEVIPTSQVCFEFLTKILGQNRVGNDPGRILQICSRISKTFGKPGRPKKTTSTTVLP